jgi:hypothetical protein
VVRLRKGGNRPLDLVNAEDSSFLRAHNNIAYVTAAGSNLQVLDNYGRLILAQNWFKTGYTPFTVAHPKGTITDNGTVNGSAPGFVNLAGQDFHLLSSSPCINDGTVLRPLTIHRRGAEKHGEDAEKGGRVSALAALIRGPRVAQVEVEGVRHATEGRVRLEPTRAVRTRSCGLRSRRVVPGWHGSCCLGWRADSAGGRGRRRADQHADDGPVQTRPQPSVGRRWSSRQQGARTVKPSHTAGAE